MAESKYDSRHETERHINQVRVHIAEAVQELVARGIRHDETKLSPEEKPLFDVESPKLKELKYDSAEYKQSLERLGTALKHHYAHNSHHPEHYGNGVYGMDLFDLLEMVCDWKAAALRNASNGKVMLDHNFDRFKIEGQLAEVLRNTLSRWKGKD